LAQDETIRALVRDIVDEVEFNEKRSLAPKERAELEDWSRSREPLHLDLKPS